MSFLFFKDPTQKRKDGTFGLPQDFPPPPPESVRKEFITKFSRLHGLPNVPRNGLLSLRPFGSTELHYQEEICLQVQERSKKEMRVLKCFSSFEISFYVQYRLFCKSFATFVSRNDVSVSDTSAVNLIVGWWLFAC